MNESNKSYRGSLILVVVLLGLLTAFALFLLLPRKTKASKIARAQTPEAEPDEDTVMIYNLIKKTWPSGINSEYLTAITMHETDEFTSDAFTQDNNLFGMHHPVKRKTLSKGVGVSGYAHFDSLDDSVKDLKLWFEYHALPVTYDNISDIIKTMKDKSYFEASYIKYNAAVVKHYKHLITIL